jgi:hypothetical protein
MGLGKGKAREVIDEFRSVVLSRGRILDVILPPLVFLGVKSLAGDQWAMAASLLIGGSLVLLRTLRREPTVLAFLGLSGSLLAFLAARWLQRAELFFLPDIVTNVALAVICFITAALRRPMVAWTSHVVRRWPRGWYWHPRVLPAYTEVTLAWGLFFLLQAGIQWALFLRKDVILIAASSLLNGWPATALLLILTYLYGTWRLPRLAGPSVAEFVDGLPEPWSSQRRGF